MNHACSSDKEDVSLNRQSKTTDKNCCPPNRIAGDSSQSVHCSKTHGHFKMKRLKSHRERNQLRGCGKKASKSRSHAHHCRQPASKDLAHLHICCHSSHHCPSRRDAPLPNVVSATQEPSIITDSRLIGHQGLFNREVKSIDIERLLSKQRKLEKSKQEMQSRKNASSCPSLSCIPSPFCSNGQATTNCSEADGSVPFERKTDSAEKTPHNYFEEEKRNSHISDTHLTAQQRPQQQLDPLFGGCKSALSSKDGSLNVVVIETTKTKSDTPRKGRGPQQSSNVDKEPFNKFNEKVKEHLICSPEPTPKSPKSPIHNTHVHSLSRNPAELSSCKAPNTFDKLHRRQDPDCVSQSISAVAARLCNGLQFPSLRRRDLAAESRGVLLKALLERHGPLLQENLLQMQRCFSCSPADKAQDQETSSTDTDEFLQSGPFTPTVAGGQSHLYTHRSTPFRIPRSSPFNRNTSPQPQRKQKQESLLDDVLRLSRSPQFCMRFEPAGAPVGENLFPLPPTFSWAEKAPASQHWEDRFNRPKTREVLLGASEDRFLSAPARHPHQHNHFHLFNQFRAPLSPASLRSQPTDMINYPPSHMLEGDHAHLLSSFSSLERWSFPPMRLY